MIEPQDDRELEFVLTSGPKRTQEGTLQEERGQPGENQGASWWTCPQCGARYGRPQTWCAICDHYEVSALVNQYGLSKIFQ